MNRLKLEKLATDLAGRLVAKGVSNRSGLRRNFETDGRMTLLTVDFSNLTPHAIRLAESFRRNIEPGGRVVVVQNGDRAHNRQLRAAGLEVRGFGLNITHGRALDWGMRFVESQYVLVCDPDAFILSSDLREELFSRLRRFGIAGISINGEADYQYFHPICLAFETRMWKEHAWSWIQDMSVPGRFRDVGWELTEHVGGFRPEAALPLTHVGIAGHVYANSFTCTFGTSRIATPGYEIEIDGRNTADTLDYQERWVSWVDRVARGDDGLAGFPV